jgi:hypothetical protein
MSIRYVRGIAVSASSACVALVLTACGSETSEPQASDERPASVIGDPLHRALDRAESVQDTVDARAADLRQRLEEAEGN